MGNGHAHRDDPTGHLRIGRAPRIAVLALIGLSGVLALLGVVRWWPDDARLHRAEGLVPVTASGVTIVHAELVTVRPACTSAKSASRAPCGDSVARIGEGASAGETVPVSLPPDVVSTGLQRGDSVLLFDLTHAKDAPGGGFDFYRADRGRPLVALAILFAVVVVLVAWRRGVMALLSLGFAGLVVIGFLIPALLSGQPAVPTTVAASVLILIVMLYATHGISMRTSVALLGALIGIALSAGLAWLGIIGARIGGLGDDSAELLIFNVRWLDVQQLIVASVILAGLGTLNDVTVTQASAVWELRGASPGMPRADLFRRAMRIGRDHVASTVYALVFAYLGTALVLIVAVQLSRGAPSDFVTAENVAEEIVRALVGGIALALAMPITTAVATLVVAARTPIDPTAEDVHSAPRVIGRAAWSGDPLPTRLGSSWDAD